MKIFVSSLIGGMEPLRLACREAILSLGHQPVMAEDFMSQPSSPQITCLSGVRQSAAVVLIIGERYGQKQPGSGLSPTHEEFEEAKSTRPVFVFVQEGVTREPEEAAFADAVQGWAGGYFRSGFRSSDQLRALVTNALHNWEVANATAPVDIDKLLTKGLAAVPKERRGYSGGTERCLGLAVVSGPEQTILRPAKIEDPGLTNDLRKDALYGAHPVFDPEKGTSVKIDGSALVISQSALVDLRLETNGTIILRVPLPKPNDAGMSSFMIIYEEDVEALLTRSLLFVSDVLDKIDPTQRLTHAAIVASLLNTNMAAWKKKGQRFDGSRTARSYSFDEETKPVQLSPAVRPRASLRHQVSEISEDFVTLLKRQSQWD